MRAQIEMLAVVTLCVAVAGCMNPLAIDRLAVAPISISDQKQYLADIGTCTAGTNRYQGRLTATSMIFGGIVQGLGVISYALLNPWMPVLGALGGAGKSAVSSIDPVGTSRGNVFRNCMIDQTGRDHSAIIAKPDN